MSAGCCGRTKRDRACIVFFAALLFCAFLRDEQISVPGLHQRVDVLRDRWGVTSLPARRFQAILRTWDPPPAARDVVKQILNWNAALSSESAAAAIYEMWISALPVAIFAPQLGARVDLRTTLENLEREPDPKALAAALDATISKLEKVMGETGSPGPGAGASRTIPASCPRCSRDWRRILPPDHRSERLGQIRDDQHSR